jgi:hypothetical protein
MASWGNEQNQRYQQDMDSNGQKLKVRNTSGAYQPSDWRVDIEDTGQEAKALRVDGKIQLKRGDRVCGVVRPEISNPNVNALGLNSGSDDGDKNVEIGYGSEMGSGNTVTIMGSNIWIGNTAQPASYRVAIGGPVQVSGGTAETLHVVGRVVADTRVSTPSVECLTTNAVLNIGTEQAAQILVGRAGRFMTIYGRLNVEELTELSGGLNVAAGDLHVNENVTVGGSLSAPSLTGPTTVQQDSDQHPTLIVHHLSASNSVPALKVVNDSTTAQGMGGYFRAPRAIVAEGETTLSGPTILQSNVLIEGETKHLNIVHMQEEPIHLGGEGMAEVSIRARGGRFEVLVGGRVRFYVDETGGHNA